MMRGALRGRTAIVTGAGSGIAAAVSRALSGAGASVVLAAADGAAIEALAADISSAGGHAVAVPTDITNPLSLRRLVEQTLGAFGRLDAAVNDVRPPAVSLAMRYQITPMRRAGGSIVNLVDLVDPVDPAAGRKAGVLELTRAAAAEVAGSGVRVNAVAAGPRDGEAEVAAAVVWLCSDDASGVSGKTLHVPNGRPLWTWEANVGGDRERGAVATDACG